MQGKLYLCATPIGNLEDITYRVLRTLKEVDLIAAEDTRHTLKLLTHFDIKKPMVSYFEHNRRQRGEEIVGKILEGSSCALVSDAGTPLISDPGEDLIKLCDENDIKVVPIPGACALVQGLIVSGLETGRFAFEGFLSVNNKNRKERLGSLKNEERTMIFYEAPHKLLSTLKDMYNTFGDRKISISREITKKFEETLRFTLKEAITYFEQNSPKGEFVLVLKGAEEKDEEIIKPEFFTPIYDEYIKKGLKKNDALKEIADKYGMKKNEIYKKLLEEKEQNQI